LENRRLGMLNHNFKYDEHKLENVVMAE